MAEIITKSEYARRMGVNPAAVSNWIRRRKLTAPAVRSDGKIVAELADEQLGRTVDPIYSAAATRRQMTEDTGEPVPGWSPTNQVNMQLLRAKAVSATVDAERKRRELESERGKYVLAADAQAAWAKVMSDFVLEVEQSLSDLTYRLDGLDRRAMLVELRRWWRRVRQAGADANQVAADEEVEFVEDVAGRSGDQRVRLP